MPGFVPLTEGWTLSGEALPERLLERRDIPGFTLPGAQELAAFASLLIGQDADEAEDAQSRTPDGAPFRLPALLPQDMPGCAELTREIDLRLLQADHAQLVFDLLTGRGEALLDGEPVASFDHEPLTLDLTPLLTSSRTHTITLRFDGTRPAGVTGPILLHTSQCARLQQIALTPDAREEIIALRACIHAQRAGCYQLRAIPCPADGALAAAEPPMAREVSYTLQAGEQRDVEFAFELKAERFVPGRAYAAPAVKLLLFYGSRTLCDVRTLLCGYPGAAPRAWLPLDDADLRLPPQTLADRLQALHIPGAGTAQPVSDPHARSLLRAGVHLRLALAQDHPQRPRLGRLPNAAFCSEPVQAQSPDAAILSAWALGGMTGHPRLPDPCAAADELLLDLAGRSIQRDAQETGDVLAWLRAVRVRLGAEAFRQGRYDGALCAPGEWRQPDIADALGTALAPVHLSALPLYGAWWTDSRFSASLHAAVSEADLPPAVRGEQLIACARLEAEDGSVLASFEAPCPPGGGPVGTLCAVTPDTPCALTLYTRILCGGAVVEQSELPVYVGERGVLEAAFSGCP